MLAFAAKRLGQAVVVMLLVTFGVSALSDLIPGSAASLILSGETQPQAVARVNAEYGFNKPLLARYWMWLTHIAHGNLGVSVQSNQTVGHILLSHLPVTVEVALLSLFISLLFSIPLALICGLREDGFIDRTITFLASACFSMPTFVAGVFLLEIFAAKAGWLPAYGWVPITQDLSENLQHALLPVTVLVLATTPLFLRVLRADVIGVLKEDFVLNARAKGLSDRYILVHHVLRPASLSLFTLAGIVFGFLMGGSIIVETTFSLPGIGQAVGQAVLGKDLPVVQGTVVLVAAVFLLINLVVDLGYVFIDPQGATQS